MSFPKIAIVGAGPAGCTLALILHRAGISSTIFEGEAGANSRNQGGTLDLHDGTGLTAIKRAGLEKEFHANARYDGEAMIIANKHFRRYINMGGAKPDSKGGRPEIDRAVLRTMLIEALPPNTVKWNHKLRRIDDNDPSNITLHFDNNIVEKGYDLIVGADGAWSKIRALLTPVKPAYAGMAMIRYSIPDAEKRHPALHKTVNRGSLFAFSDGKAITAQQLGDGSLSVGCTRVLPEDYLTSHKFHTEDAKRSRDDTLSNFSDWDAELKALIAAADEDEVPWAANLYSLPIGTRWAHRPGLTVIGDAAHVMVPWAGEGVNVSMDDSVKLADAIIACTKEVQRSKATVSSETKKLSKAVGGYEEEMFVRSGKTAGMSWDMMNAMFYETGAPDATMDRYIIKAASDGMPWYVVPFLAVLVRTYFTWFRWWYPGLGKIH